MASNVPGDAAGGHIPQDISSQILTKVSEATTKTLTADLASSWVTELHRTILETKDRIHERISAELPAFNRQLETSKSVQTRLQNLSNNVEELSVSLLEPQTGLLPNLVKSLSEHAALAQRTSDSNVSHHALTYLSTCNAEFSTLSKYAGEGALVQAIKSCRSLEGIVAAAPEPLAKADVMADLKRRLRSMRDLLEEQLDDVYHHGVKVTSSEITICPSVQVRNAQAILSLSDILTSLSHSALAGHLSSLRRDLIAYFIEYPLQRPISLTVSSSKDQSGTPGQILSMFPSANITEATPPLEFLTSLLTFLSENLFSKLPHPEFQTFPQSLCTPITNALLQRLLVPAMPSSLVTLPPFLGLVKETVLFEQDASKLLGGTTDDEIKVWADNVGSHYERKRRIDILARSRDILTATGGDQRTFTVEVSGMPDKTYVPDVVAVQGDDGGAEEAVDGWGLDEGEATGEKNSFNGDAEEAWGLDEEQPDEPDTLEEAPAREVPPEDREEDPSDAWGWNDDEEEVPGAADEHDGASEETAWDDAWNEPPPKPLTPPPSAPLKQPKLAKRLEKFSTKGKSGGLESPASSMPSTPAPLADLSPSNAGQSGPPTPSHNISGRSALPNLGVDSSLKTRLVERERYSVSGRADDIFDIVKATLAEGHGLAGSDMFSDFPSSSASPPGTIVLQTAASVLDLFRALYPITLSSLKGRNHERSMRFSNDCLYLGEQIESLDVRQCSQAVKDQLHSSAERLKSLGEWWFESDIGKHQTKVVTVLERANGFIDTTNQDRFDDCEEVMGSVLREIMSVGSQWKICLPRTRYYHAIGAVVDAALTKILEDVLAIPDITATESKKLNELCRMLNALESLFLENADASSLIVAYVPSWLKYSYLSELLEASIADISYLFDEGALVDFQIEELVSLVRALFADTPLRTNTISKLMAGHPPSH